MNNLDKIIQIIREQMVANAPGTQGGGGESADPKGPFAGFSPRMNFVKRKKIIGLGQNSRNRWKNPPQV